tara:strand:+ start:43987 stop:48036 length:4050 start_codon:yes stop_codon:yes gene_type:complete
MKKAIKYMYLLCLLFQSCANDKGIIHESDLLDTIASQENVEISKTNSPSITTHAIIVDTLLDNSSEIILDELDSNYKPFVMKYLGVRNHDSLILTTLPLAKINLNESPSSNIEQKDFLKEVNSNELKNENVEIVESGNGENYMLNQAKMSVKKQKNKNVTIPTISIKNALVASNLQKKTPKYETIAHENEVKETSEIFISNLLDSISSVQNNLAKQSDLINTDSLVSKIIEPLKKVENSQRVFTANSINLDTISVKANYSLAIIESTTVSEMDTIHAKLGSTIPKKDSTSKQKPSTINKVTNAITKNNTKPVSNKSVLEKVNDIEKRIEKLENNIGIKTALIDVKKSKIDNVKEASSIANKITTNIENAINENSIEDESKPKIANNSNNYSLKSKESTITENYSDVIPDNKVSTSKNKEISKAASKDATNSNNQIKTSKGIVINSTNDKQLSDLVVNQKNNTVSSNSFNLKILNGVPEYNTNQKHTVLVEIQNTGNTPETVQIGAILPNGWRIISISSLKPFMAYEKRNALLSFYIPADSPSGKIQGKLYLKNINHNEVKSFEVYFNVAPNYALEIVNVNIPQNIQAGEQIEATYIIKNNGNTEQNINLKSKNIIEGVIQYKINPDSTIIVHVSQKTNNKIYTIRNVSTNLEVLSSTSGKTYKAFNSAKVFPVKIKQEDAYFRFPIKASLFYNSYTTKNNHFSSMSGEVTGNGYLDLEKDHYLNFVIRGPRQDNLKRFGVTDQYSLIYSHKNETRLHLGDHSYNINRLGFNGKYGMGFKLDQDVNKWTLSAFYTKPRLYDYNSEALYGFKTVYHANEHVKAGVSLVRSKRSDNTINRIVNNNVDEKGQILTFNFDYFNQGTKIVAESSASITNQHIDFANYVNLSKKFNNITYSGSFTIAGENYFGTLNNSIQFSNSLNYNISKWNFSIGQGLYKVNQRLNPLFYAAEPHFENYYASFGYRINNHHYMNFRFDRRIREDQLEPKNYHYNEYGFNYAYKYSKNSFVANFNGRLGKTKNMLSANSNYRDTYSHNLNLSYRFLRNLRIQGSINHNYSNRYGNSNTNINYIRYNAGFNYNLSQNLRISANYNSGFSPEDSYIKRDYINANLVANINRNHQLEIRANYFENPGNVTKKELLAYAKYTYTFGAPLKKVLQQGGLLGHVVTTDPSINIKGVKIIGTGKTVMTDKNGNFELNNLPLGKNYILVEQSTLQQGVITSAKIPYEVIITEDEKAELIINLVKSSSIYGRFELNILKENADDYNLQGYIKLENNDFTYYAESNKQGIFKFDQIVPGNYKISLIRFKENTKLLVVDKTIMATLKAGEKFDGIIRLKTRDRKIRFKNKNFKVGK